MKDAANDCYASWKIFQVLDTLRKEEGSEIPSLIDYGDVIRRRSQDDYDKRMKRLIERGRKIVQDGRECQKLVLQIHNLVSLRISRTKSI
jgi:hypothetical protein